jgi:aspartyl-tRNA(Asn)/glutamyl-tRNA(Gln) amidotransferase subunit A
MGDWEGMSAADLGRGIEAGRIDPIALTDAFLDAIATHEFGRRIYARATPARARAEAEAARERARRGLRKSPLDGVPISWKDLFDTAGIATEAGTALLKGRTPERDARVLQTATAQGLICLGKTHMTELAFSGLGLNPVTESPPCINDHEAVSGGSSSGAATSVAFGLAAAGIGSDTGGSVRVPAAWNDLVGLKTTSGRLPLDGVVPLAARFDTVGPLARTVEDAALLLAALEGGRPADLRGASAKGVRLLNLTTSAQEDIREAPARAHDDALSRLRAGGVTMEDGAVPEVAEAMDLAGILYTPETYGTWGHLIETDPDAMFPPVRERFRAGKAHGAADYVAAWHKLDRLRAAYAGATVGYDAVVVPTAALLPPKQADVARDHALFTSENLLTLRNTRIGNLMGLAVLTLPTGHPSCGLSLMGPPRSEERLLRLGAALAPLLT